MNASVLALALILPSPAPMPVGPALLAAPEGFGEFPHVRQETEYTCGPACLRSALLARGTPAPNEAELAKTLGTTVQDGTGPEQLAAGARRFGLGARVQEGLRLRDLAALRRSGRAVVLHYQSGGEGHWALLRGFEGGRIVLMDPWAQQERATLRLKDFLRAWHGEHLGRSYERGAVVIDP